MMEVRNNLAETLFSLFVKIRNSNSGSEDSIIGMFRGKVCCGLGCEILAKCKLSIVLVSARS